VPVRIRMKMMGRKHRPFFRICAVDGRNPRDGRVLEELGTYDPMIPDTDARVLLDTDRIGYWIGVGAQPSDNVKIFLKKYGVNGTHIEQQRSARERLALPKIVPPAPEPVYVAPPKGAAQAEPVAVAADADGASAESTEATPEVKTEAAAE
jgi:small subunit ribosomal protein S16